MKFLSNFSITVICFAVAQSTSLTAPRQLQPVDLAPYVTQPWGSFQPFAEWNLPAGGVQTLNEILFDISGVVQLTGKEHAQKGYLRPVVQKIPIQQREFTHLHLLHYCQFSSGIGQPVAIVLVHYDTGETYSFPLRFGVHCMDWYQTPGRPSVTGKTTTAAWMMASASSRSRQVTGIWHTAIPNPHPEKRVKEIEFQSLFANSSYTLVGLTLEKANPEPPLEEHSGPRQSPRALSLATKTLQCVDAVTSQPIAHAKATVSLKSRQKLLPWGDYSADDNGRIKVLVPEGHEMDLLVGGASHGPKRFTVGANSSDPLKLNRTETIGGIIDDGSGKPLADATISLVSVEGSRERGFRLFHWPTVMSDAKGRWTVASPENFRGLEIRISHPDFLSAIYEVGREKESYLIPEAQLKKREARMRLTKGVNIIGQVLNSAGRAITNASVTWFAGGDVTPLHRVSSDGEGRFTIRNLEPGPCAVIVSAPGHTPSLSRHNLAGPELRPELRLRNAVPLKVKVQDDESQPVRGACLMLVEWDGLRWVDSMHLSKEDGNLIVEAVPQETAKYFIGCTGMSSQILVAKPADGLQTVTLSR